MNPQQKAHHIPFLVLFGIITLATVFVFLPFFEVLVIAAVFATMLYPLYEIILKKVDDKEVLAALIVIVITLVFIIVPLIFLGYSIFNESRDLYLSLQSGNSNALESAVSTVQTQIQRVLPNFAIDFRTYLSGFLSSIGMHVGWLVTSTVQVLLGIFLTILALFFFLKDGKRIAHLAVDTVPLDKEHSGQIMRKVKNVINAVIKGALLVAVIQGILAGIGLTIFGVPNPTLWGVAAAFGALLPGIGTAIILIPAIVYLILQGTTAAAMGLAIWGVLIVGLVDNMLVPYIYGRGAKIHPLLVLFSVLGGLVVFGAVGFLVGPIIVSLFLVMLDLYRGIILERQTM